MRKRSSEKPTLKTSIDGMDSGLIVTNRWQK